MKKTLFISLVVLTALGAVGCRGRNRRDDALIASGAPDEPKLNRNRIASAQRMMAPVIQCDPKEINLRFLQSIEPTGSYRSYVYEVMGCQAITSIVLGCDNAICNWLDPERAARIDGNCPNQPLQQSILTEQQLVIYSGCGQTLAYKIYRGKMLKAQPPAEFSGRGAGTGAPPPPPPPPPPAP